MTLAGVVACRYCTHLPTRGLAFYGACETGDKLLMVWTSETRAALGIPESGPRQVKGALGVVERGSSIERADRCWRHGDCGRAPLVWRAGRGDAKIQFMFQRCNETLGRQVGTRLSTV